MEIKRCPNGHYYDPSISGLCPICGAAAEDALPVLASDPQTWQDRLKLLKGYAGLKKISSGSTCDVYRVEMAGESYALKVIDCGSDKNKLRYAQYEIHIMERLRTFQGVVHLVDSEILYSNENAVVFLLEEYVRSFEDYYKNTDVTVRDAVKLGIQISQALEECREAGVAHLDVQPKNLFVNEKGKFLLGDFGSSLTVDLLEREQQLRGTLSYMAPEVYHGRQYSQASDIYALGMVLYTILNGGMLPFADRMPKEEAIRERLNGTPLPPLTRYGNALGAILNCACASQPNCRYQTFNALMGALLDLMMGEEDCALSASVKEQPKVAEKAAPAPKKAAKKGLFGAFAAMFQKEPAAPVDASVPQAVPIPTGRDLFADEAVRCDAPVFWTANPGDAGFVSTVPLGCSNTVPLTVPCAPSPAGSPFDADSLDPAYTSCALGRSIPLSSPAPGGLFDSDRAAYSVPLTIPCAPNPAGNLFDSDSFATSCALDYGSPMPTAPVPGGNLFDSDSFATSCALDYGSPMPTAPVPGGNLFDSDSFASTCALMPPAPVPAAAPRMDQVQFSAVAPKEAMKGEYSIIQIFMYEQAFRSVVEEALEMMDAPAQEKKSGIHKVRENTRVKIVLTCKEMEIEDNELEQVWCGGYLQFDFAICPPEELQKRQLLLTAQVYFDDVPATRLMLTVKPTASFEEQVEMARQDILTAFVSYASQDRSRVGALVQGMRKARPDMDIFFDVTTLRSGDDWESTLYREIARRDILFLCWSRYARDSEWVEREWRYALAQKGTECIEPIPLEQPDICPPPRELSSKHFNDSLLYIINR